MHAAQSGEVPAHAKIKLPGSENAPADTGAENPTKEMRIPGVHAAQSGEVPAHAKIKLPGSARAVLGRPAESCGRRLIAGGTKKAPSDAGG